MLLGKGWHVLMGLGVMRVTWSPHYTNGECKTCEKVRWHMTCISTVHQTSLVIVHLSVCSSLVACTDYTHHASIHFTPRWDRPLVVESYTRCARSCHNTNLLVCLLLYLATATVVCIHYIYTAQYTVCPFVLNPLCARSWHNTNLLACTLGKLYTLHTVHH